jgi:glycosyltransferase involved in cell wall biosynthesis
MNTEKPLVSVLTTAYNTEKYIGAAIESVLAQTMADFEFVLRDDGSTDSTLEILKDYAKKDARIKIFSGPNTGMAAGTNELIKKARGTFIGLLDSDDLLAPTALEETVKVFQATPSAGMVYTDHYDMAEDGTVRGLGFRCKIPYSKERLLIDMMTFHFRMFRRSTFDLVGLLDSGLEAAPDYDLCLRVSEQCQIVHLPRPLYLYRVHDKSISTSQRLDQINESKLVVEQALKRRGLDREYELFVQLSSKFTLVKKA